jgi:polysaccharide pyruvyl transferase WcaK-like protein
MRLLFLADVSGRVAHVGDEAMLEANISLFRRLFPGCSIEVAAGPGWDGKRLQARAVPRLEFPPGSEEEREKFLDALDPARDPGDPAARAALSCDALIISGGGNLSGSWPHHIYERLAMARLAAARGTPVILIGQTLGPDFRPRERALVSELLRLCAWIGLREPYSHALALELGAAQERLSYQLDDAAFFTPQQVTAQILRQAGVPVDRPWIAVTVHPIGELSIGNPVVTQFASALRRIAEATGAALVFIPHVVMEEHDVTPADAQFAEAINRALFGNPPMHIAPVLPAPQALWLTQQAALVISTRYHPLVFALAGGVPAIGLWSDEYTRRKLLGALIHAGRTSDAMSINDALDGGLATRAIELWHSRAALKIELQARAEIWSRAEEARCAKLQALLLSILQSRSEGKPPLTEVPQQRRTITLPVLGLDEAVTSALTGEYWETFHRQGFMHLGPVCLPQEAQSLARRAESLGITEIGNRITDAELRPFYELMHHPLMHEICARIFGPGAPAIVFQSEVQDANSGETPHTWRQNAGRLHALDRDELVTVLVGLDATGSPVEVIPGSHRLGLLDRKDGVLSARDAANFCQDDLVHPLTVEPGHALLLHKWLVHRPARSAAGGSQRAAAFWFADGRARSVISGRNEFPMFVGEADSEPYPWMAALQAECAALRERFAEAERYALSLEKDDSRVTALNAECAALRAQFAEAERYAHSLEKDDSRVTALNAECAALRAQFVEAERYALSLEKELRRLQGELKTSDSP